MSTVAQRIASRVSSPSGGEASPSPTAESVSDASAARPPTGATSGADSAAGASEDVAESSESSSGSPTPESPPAAPTTHDLLAEKLAAVRQQNRERKELAAGRRARESAEAEAARIRAEAAADREAAQAERAKWEGARGDYKKAFEELGLNAREVYEEMTRQAIEADTPEAKLKAMQAAWKAEMDATVAPLQKELAELRDRDKRARLDAAERGFSDDFAATVKSETYSALRVEYPDERLFNLARDLRDNPDALFSEARRLNVRLTDPSQGFTMADILNVMHAAHGEHEQGRESRRQSSPSAAPANTAPTDASAKQPTVNGTTAPRNAGSATIGNDLATARASDGKFIPRGTSAAQRIRERARRS